MSLFCEKWPSFRWLLARLNLECSSGFRYILRSWIFYLELENQVRKVAMVDMLKDDPGK